MLTLACVSTAATLAGCSGSQPVRFYVLNSVPNANTDVMIRHYDDLVVAVGAIGLPDYLMRPEIVTYSGPNELVHNEYDRWAEPLRENMARVIAENLTSRISTDHVVTYPWRAPVDPKYRVNLDVSRFEETAENEVLLVVTWGITQGDGNDSLVKRKSIKSRQLASDRVLEHKERVQMMSELLAELSWEIAREIQGLENG